MNILHAWTVNSVNRLVKNPKHITAITFSSEPNIYQFVSQASSQEYLLIYITNTRLLAFDMGGWLWWREGGRLVVEGGWAAFGGGWVGGCGGGRVGGCGGVGVVVV